MGIPRSGRGQESTSFSHAESAGPERRNVRRSECKRVRTPRRHNHQSNGYRLLPLNHEAHEGRGAAYGRNQNLRKKTRFEQIVVRRKWSGEEPRQQPTTSNRQPSFNRRGLRGTQRDADGQPEATATIINRKSSIVNPKATSKPPCLSLAPLGGAVEGEFAEALGPGQVDAIRQFHQQRVHVRLGLIVPCRQAA